MKLFYLCLFLALVSSCKKDNEFVAPSVKTTTPSAITVNSATLSGSLAVRGSDPISDHGFFWSASPGVSATTGTTISIGISNDVGPFESTLNGLSRGKKYYYAAFVKAKDKVYLGDEISFVAGAQSITSVSSMSVKAGSTLTIFGKDFVSDPARTSVKIGNVNAVVNSATETQIDVTLPLDISGGSKTVAVKIDDVEVSFSSNVAIVPFIEGISTSWGFAGDTVEIVGSGFGSVQEVSVIINSQNTSITSAAYNKIKFLVPSGLGGLGTASVTTNGTPSSNSINFASVAWRKLTDLPITGRFSASSFIINNILYVGMGSSQSGTRFKDFWKVDLQTGGATRLNDFPGGERFDTRCFAIGNKGYIVLGYDNSAATLNELWEYNPDTDVWTSQSSFPGSLRNEPVAFVLNGKAYVGCGIANGITSLSDIYQYDPITNAWSSATPFGGGPIYGQGSFVIGNKAYVIAGTKNNSTLVNDFWEFDGSNWTRKANYPGQLITDALGFNSNNLGCAGFGWIDNNTAGIENWTFKPSSNYWKKVESFSGPARFNAISGSTEKYWYVGLGLKGNAEYSDIWIIEFP